MKLLEALLNTLPADPIPVRKVVIGIHWTLVGSRNCGLGSTQIGEGSHGHSLVRDVGVLHRKSAQELAHWVLSDNLLEASIGIAALNSLVEVDENKLEQVNAAEVITRESKDKNLCVIGHFPFVNRIKPIVKNCWVIEKRPFGDDFFEEAAITTIQQGAAFPQVKGVQLVTMSKPVALT